MTSKRKSVSRSIKRAFAPKPSKPAAAPKKTAEQLSDQEQQRLLFHHKRRLKPLLEAEKNAKAAVSGAYELAKKEGVTKKAIELAIQLDTEEGREKLQTEIQAKLNIDRWMGAHVGTQLELFAKQDSRERHFEDGRIAALDDKPAKPPEHLSQQATRFWLDGHADGLKQLNEQRAQGFKPLGAVASDTINDLGERKAA